MAIKQKRLSKVIASSGYCSRREAEKLIENDLVKVNNQIVSTQGIFVDNQDVITINNQTINTTKIKTRFFLYHKPKGLITNPAVAFKPSPQSWRTSRAFWGNNLCQRLVRYRCYLLAFKRYVFNRTFVFAVKRVH